MTTRLDRILALLSDSHSSFEVKQAASQNLCELIQSHSDSDLSLLRDRLRVLIGHSSYETRVHASKPLSLCLRAVDFAVDPELLFSELNVLDVIASGIPLFASSISLMEETSNVSVEKQRENLTEQIDNQKLVHAQVLKEQLREIIADDDLVIKRTSSASFLSNGNGPDKSAKRARMSVSTDAISFMNRLRNSGNRLVDMFMAETWQERHGAFMVLKHFVSSSAVPNDILVRCLIVLGLDRFCDFSTDTVTAPVRDLAAQCLSLGLSHLQSPTAAADSAKSETSDENPPLQGGGGGPHEPLQSVLEKMKTQLYILLAYPDWQARLGAALALQYIAARSRRSFLLDAGLVVRMLDAEPEEDVASVLCAVLRLMIPFSDENVALEETILDVAYRLVKRSSLVNAVRLLDAAATHVDSSFSKSSAADHRFQKLDASCLQHLFRNANQAVRDSALKAAIHLDAHQIDPSIMYRLSDSTERAALWLHMGPPAPVEGFFYQTPLLTVYSSEYSHSSGNSAASVLDPVEQMNLVTQSIPLTSRAVETHPSEGFTIIRNILSSTEHWKVQWYALQVLSETSGLPFPEDVWTMIEQRCASTFALSETEFPEELKRLSVLTNHSKSLAEAKEYLRGLAADKRDPLSLAALGALDRIVKESSTRIRVAACCAVIASGRLPEKLNPILQTICSDAPQGHIFCARAMGLFFRIKRSPNPSEKLLGVLLGNLEQHRAGLIELCRVFGGSLFDTFPQLVRPGVIRIMLDGMHDRCLDHLASNPVYGDGAMQGMTFFDGLENDELVNFATKRPAAVVRFLVSTRPQRMANFELLGSLFDAVNVKLLPWAALFVRALLSGITSGQAEAASAFAKLIQFLPLAQDSIADSDQNPTKSKFFATDAEFAAQYESETRFLRGLLDSSTISRFELPADLIRSDVTLRPYQKDGISWLAFLREFQLHGVLADDMGLGKTLQTICMLAATPGRHLVICPTTLVSHWRSEMEKYAGHLLTKDRVDVLSYIEMRSRFTQYSNAVENGLAPVTGSLWDTDYAYLVLDEGHILRNPKSKMAQAVRSLSMKARHRLILTGTPIHNSAQDLVALFSLIMPGFFSTQDAKSTDKLHKLVLPFVMRRRKEDVLKDLPPKIIQDITVDPSDLQRSIFRRYMIEVGAKDSGKNEEASTTLPDGESMESDGGELRDGKRSTAFKTLQFLRRLCTHPALCVPTFSTKQALSSALTGAPLVSFDEAPKFAAFGELISALRSGNHRALVFAQSKSTLDLVEMFLSAFTLPSESNSSSGVSLDIFSSSSGSCSSTANPADRAFRPTTTSGGLAYLRLDGDTPGYRRGEMVSLFNNDASIDILMLTTSVGGLGLNLTGADTVIFLEHDWNPQNDLQAMDRAHRLGQTRSVNVFRIVMKDLLEERIMGIQAFKLAVARAVVNEENSATDKMVSGGADVLQIVQQTARDLVKPGASSSAASTNIKTSKKSADAAEDDVSAVGGMYGKLLADMGEMWGENDYEEMDVDSFAAKFQKE
eukprot:ANDGO_05312.mRNA.1 putative helicase mot1